MSAPSDEELEALRERVVQFNLMKLPGQPQGMHMGTSYMVSDLIRAVVAIRDERRELRAAVIYAFANSRLCFFGGGKDGQRTSCVFGCPGCACDDFAADNRAAIEAARATETK